MEKDDLGLEIDDDVAAYLKDPKSGLLGKVLDYRERRQTKQKELAEIEAKKTVKSEEKLFGIF